MEILLAILRKTIKLIIILIFVGIGALYWYYPSVGLAPDLKVKMTKDMYRRGK